MPPSRPSSVRLPDAWPTRVRSAMVHIAAITRTSLVLAHAEADNAYDERLRLRAEVERLPPQRRPYYPPMERLAILELRAARGWTVAETARRLLVTSVTVASWNSRLGEEGPDALLKVPVPVN